jgi:hypothetical protein
VKDRARILWWDRLGTIVTEAIRYDESSHLAKFFRWYSAAPDVMRGKDEMASVPSKKETRAAHTALCLDATLRWSNFLFPVQRNLHVTLLFLPLKQHCIHRQGMLLMASAPMIYSVDETLDYLTM